jgi:predicted  nucleic acid-binding Zn-ribbon protein
MSVQINLLHAKVFYFQADAWVAAETTEQTINQAIDMMQAATKSFVETMALIEQDLQEIGEKLPKAEEKNPGLTSQMAEILD